MTLNLGKVTVLIGEQATGKSTVAKLLAVCRYFSYFYDEGFYAGEYKSSILEGLAAWGLEYYYQPNTFILYECEHYNLKIEYKTDKLENGEERFLYPVIESKSDRFKNLLDKLEGVAIKKNEVRGTNIAKLAGIPTSFYLNEVKQVLDNPFFLPTERGLQSIFSLPKGSVGNLSDTLYNQIAAIDKISDEFKDETLIQSLDIYYLKTNGIGYIRKQNELLKYLLKNSASGYQSLIPIELICNYYLKRNRPKTLIIEELELNIFPSAQMKLVQFLVNYTNLNGGSLLLPTHSPYILTSLNNCMLAHHVGHNPKNNDKAKIVLPEKYWINPDDVSAYLLKTDGTAEDIIDWEEKLIKAEKIDLVSEVISENFNQLLDLNYSK